MYFILGLCILLIAWVYLLLLKKIQENRVHLSEELSQEIYQLIQLMNETTHTNVSLLEDQIENAKKTLSSFVQQIEYLQGLRENLEREIDIYQEKAKEMRYSHEDFKMKQPVNSQEVTNPHNVWLEAKTENPSASEIDIWQEMISDTSSDIVELKGFASKTDSTQESTQEQVAKTKEIQSEAGSTLQAESANLSQENRASSQEQTREVASASEGEKIFPSSSSSRAEDAISHERKTLGEAAEREETKPRGGVTQEAPLDRERILSLYQEGKSVEQIAEETLVSRAEIALIIQLFEFQNKR